MAKLPQVMGLVFCESLDLGTGPGQASLRRLFQGRGFAAFPGPPTGFVVYAALYGEKQEGKMELVATRLETEEDVYRYTKWQHVPGEGLTLQLFLPLARVVFPAPGRYAFRLLFEDQELTQRHLEVHRKDS
jgi:hypothetical protein